MAHKHQGGVEVSDTFFYSYAIPLLWESDPVVFFILAGMTLIVIVIAIVDFANRETLRLAIPLLVGMMAFDMVVSSMSRDYSLDEAQAISSYYGVQARSVACPQEAGGDGCVAYTDAEGDYVVLKVTSGDYGDGGRQVTTKRVNDGPWPVTSTREESK